MKKKIRVNAYPKTEEREINYIPCRYIFVMLLPIEGFMLYFMFYSRKLSKKQAKRMEKLTKQRIEKDDGAQIAQICAESEIVGSQAALLNKLSDSHVYANTDLTYYPLGEHMFAAIAHRKRYAQRKSVAKMRARVGENFFAAPVK